MISLASRCVKPFNLLQVPGNSVLFLPGQDDAYGATIHDKSSYSNHGTITGATWVRLPSGLWYLDFDGSDDVLTIPNAASLHMPSGFTYSFWYRSDDNEQGPTVIKSGAFYFHLGKSAVNMEVVIYGTGGGYIGRIGGKTQNDSLWHMYTLIWDGTAASSGVSYYQDTTRKDTTNYQSGTFTALASNANDLLYGNSAILEGGLALVKVLNVGITAAKVTENYNQERYLLGV